jgi:hypothetical protein
MPAIDQDEPTDFSEIVGAIEKFQENHEVTWFRGAADIRHELKPSIFRHPNKKSIDKIHELEKDLALIFEQRSPPFVTQNFRDEWDKLFFMQHYGIPTRLLDWTESPFIALYFALANCDRNKNGSPAHDAVFWMLDPASWNQSALSDISYSGGVLNTDKEQVKSYSPDTSLEERKNLPIMVHGTHNSPRIVAQRGMFALFGKSTSSMEVSYENNEFVSGALKRIIIKKGRRDKIAQALFRKGISDSTIYPDLQGLALEMRRSLGFLI